MAGTLRFDNLSTGDQALVTCLLDTEYQHFESCSGGDKDFAIWLISADIKCRKRCGFGIFDFPDRRWRDLYDDGTRPREAVIELLADEGFPG
ncbi:hypothetical protein GCM10010174_25840 [Kutzneria viridogrisea]|uniref:Uncharacterized protein n=1 Tax=Kutzneria viridogrisea TaxID=47990 RepID=A0ABR6BRG7_9PSEU|nr:hypothetical protein [Kutzneria viridogrisea]